MVLTKKFKPFDDALLDRYPDLKDFLKPNDNYPEIKQILKNSSVNLADGSLNTKIVINQGEIVERVFKTPMGQVVSLSSKQSNVYLDHVA